MYYEIELISRRTGKPLELESSLFSSENKAEVENTALDLNDAQTSVERELSEYRCSGPKNDDHVVRASSLAETRWEGWAADKELVDEVDRILNPKT